MISKITSFLFLIFSQYKRSIFTLVLLAFIYFCMTSYKGTIFEIIYSYRLEKQDRIVYKTWKYSKPALDKNLIATKPPGASFTAVSNPVIASIDNRFSANPNIVSDIKLARHNSVEYFPYSEATDSQFSDEIQLVEVMINHPDYNYEDLCFIYEANNTNWLTGINLIDIALLLETESAIKSGNSDRFIKSLHLADGYLNKNIYIEIYYQISSINLINSYSLMLTHFIEEDPELIQKNRAEVLQFLQSNLRKLPASESIDMASLKIIGKLRTSMKNGTIPQTLPADFQEYTWSDLHIYQLGYVPASVSPGRLPLLFNGSGFGYDEFPEHWIEVRDRLEILIEELEQE